MNTFRCPTYLSCQGPVKAAHLVKEVLPVDAELALDDIIEEERNLLDSLQALSPLFPIVGH